MIPKSRSAACCLLVALGFLVGPTSGRASFSDTLFVATGEAPHDRFGFKVAAVGDLDGDGFTDIAVGAPLNDAAENNAGRAYIFLSGSGADAVPDVTISGAAAGWALGDGVSSAGDMNGDGRDDFIVGAPFFGPRRGRAFLFWGGPAFTGDISASSADVKLNGQTGIAFPAMFGSELAPIGDLNRDGLDDILVGARQWGTTGTTGRAYVFFGDPALSGVVQAADADIIITGNPWSQLGGPYRPATSMATAYPISS